MAQSGVASPPPPANYQIRDVENLVPAGKKGKFRANIEAIRTLQAIEKEGRRATPAEQDVLVRYTGWGGLPDAFAYTAHEDWAAERDELVQLLPVEEYEAARKSTQFAHYTSPDVIRGMWAGLQALGLQPGRINEPAIGIGHFFGLMPAEIAKGSSLHATEIDSISGRIAQQLYPAVDVRIMGFEDRSIPDGYFDLFISNVPFSDTPVRDQHDRGLDKLNASLHDYFFLKALKKTRPGGLVAFVTSRYTLDKQDTHIRRLLAAEADLVGALRLPQTAFRKIANTDVVTDIVILQRRLPDAPPRGDSFQNTSPQETPEGASFPINEYYHLHPENVLGQQSAQGSMYRAEDYTVLASPELDLESAIAERIAGMPLPAPLDQIGSRTAQASAPNRICPAPDHVKEGAYVIQKGGLAQRVGDDLLEVNVSKAQAERIRSIIPVRDALRSLLHLQVSPDATDEQVEGARADLGRAYDRTVRKQGPLHQRLNRSAFRLDPDSPLVLSLEDAYDPDTQNVVRAPIFERRTQFPAAVVTNVQTAQEALLASLRERGKLDLEYMTALSGKTAPELIAELGPAVYEDPQEGWVAADEYLSGNVRKKLQAARFAAEAEPRFGRNVQALEAIQPPDVPPGDIGLRLGTPWVPVEIYQRFIREVLGSPARLHYSEATARWIFEAGSDRTFQFEARQRFGTQRVGIQGILEATMNGQVITVRDTFERPDGGKSSVVNQSATVAARDRQEQLKEAFSNWIWSDPERRQALVRLYNDTFNSLILRKYDGAHLQLPGKSRDIALSRIQLDAVWRIITSGNTLLAHAVGAGKTYIMAAAIMEMRRLGLVKKAVVVVPNHLVSDFTQQMMRLYPAAKVLAGTKADFEPAHRQQMASRIATGDWDAVVIPMSSFGLMPMSPTFVESFFRQQLDALEESIHGAKAERGEIRNYVKELERAKDRLEAMMERQLARWKKDEGPWFDELGIDALFVDEAHLYKNLYFPTRMGRLSGVATQVVQRSFDMWMKTSFLNRTRGGRGVVFSTATPISNSMVEAFNLQRYLQPQILEERGLSQFDAWAATFGSTVTSMEFGPTGKIRSATRFARFVNLPELTQMMGDVTDVRTADMLKLPVPKVAGGKAEVVEAPQSEELKGIMLSLQMRSEAISKGEVDKHVDNHLKVCNDGRAAAADLRLYDETYPDRPDSKINICMENVARIWRETADRKLTQLVWCDFGPPGSDVFPLFEDMRKKLIGLGVTPEEIAAVHDVKPSEIAGLYHRVRMGEIRVLLATTAKLGLGVNVQNRLYAAHHITPTWKPAEMEQRDGRIIRQGNTCPEVRIIRYVTHGSFDVYMWQTLERKQKFITQVLAGQIGSREGEDIGDIYLRPAEVMALASGDPRILDYVGLRGTVQELELLEKDHQRSLWEADVRIRELKAAIPTLAALADQAEGDGKAFEAARERAGGKFVMEVRGTPYEKHKEAGDALAGVMGDIKRDFEQKSRTPSETVTVDAGSMCGFRLTITGRYRPMVGGQGLELAYQARLQGREPWITELGDDPTGNARRIENLFGMMTSRPTALREQVTKHRREVEVLQRSLDEPWLHATELAEKRQQLRTLALALGMEREQDEGTDPEEPEEPGEETTVDDDEGYVEFDDEQAAASGTAQWPPRTAPWQGQPMTGLNREKVVRRMEELFGVPIRARGFRRPGAIGIFRQRERIIRVRRAGDLPTIAHEIGHALDQQIEWTKNLTSVQASELESIAIQAYPSMRGRALWAEGAAMFTAEYMADPHSAQFMAPSFHALFESTVERAGLKEAVQEVVELFGWFANQGGPAAVRAHKVSGAPRKGTLAERMRWIRTKFAETQYDEWQRLAEFERAMLPAPVLSRSPLQTAYLMSGQQARAEEWMRAGGVQRTFSEWKPVGPALADILAPVADRLDPFSDYMIAKHALTWIAMGRDVGFTKEQAEETVAAYDCDDFREAQRRFTAYLRNLARYWEDAGGLPRGTVDRWEQLYPDYVPLMRLMEAIEESEGQGRSRQPYKAAKGSLRPIVDPLVSAIRMTYQVTFAAERQRVLRNVVRLAEQTPASGTWVSRYAKAVIPTEVQLAEARGALEAIGLDLTEDELMQTFVIWRASNRTPAPNCIAVWENGKVQFYQCDPELVQTLARLDGPEQTVAQRLLYAVGTPARALKAGIVLAGGFMVRNVLRDSVQGYVMNDFPQMLGAPTVAGLCSAIGQGRAYHDFMASGAAYSTWTGADIQRRPEITVQRVVGRGRLRTVARQPLTALSLLSEKFEIATRIGTFASTGKAQPVASIIDRLMTAGRQAQEASVNFSRMGTVSRLLNALLLFYNPGIQGLLTLGRNVTGFRNVPEFGAGGPGAPTPPAAGAGATGAGQARGPRRWSGRKLRKVLLRAITAITTFSLLCYLLNREDEAYWELSARDRDLYWFIPLRAFGGPPGYFIRLPKPFELGILFGSVPERAFRWIDTRDPGAFDRLGESIWQIATPSLIPTIAAPWLENWGNRSFFWNTPIVPEYLEDVEEWMQFRPSTTELAKALGRKLNVSPAEMENVVRGYTGTLGIAGLRFADWCLQGTKLVQSAPKRVRSADEIPLLRNFVVNALRYGQSVNDFYVRLEDGRRITQTADALRGQAALEYKRGHRAEIAEFARLQRRVRKINLWRDRRRRADEATGLSAADRTTQIAHCDLQILNICRMALGQEPLSPDEFMHEPLEQETVGATR